MSLRLQVDYDPPDVRPRAPAASPLSLRLEGLLVDAGVLPGGLRGADADAAYVDSRIIRGVAQLAKTVKRQAATILEERDAKELVEDALAKTEDDLERAQLTITGFGLKDSPFGTPAVDSTVKAEFLASEVKLSEADLAAAPNETAKRALRFDTGQLKGQQTRCARKAKKHQLSFGKSLRLSSRHAEDRARKAKKMVGSFL
jgi:hypothetical protein